MGETANERTGEARIRAAGSMSLRRFLRPGERIGLVRCCRLAHSPVRPFASRLLSIRPEHQPLDQAQRVRPSGFLNVKYQFPFSPDHKYFA